MNALDLTGFGCEPEGFRCNAVEARCRKDGAAQGRRERMLSGR